MVGYIYQIINLQNGKRYIGKTFNLDKRLKDHFNDLKANKHHSHKLQRAYNKYGEQFFEVQSSIHEIQNEEELSTIEIKTIEKFNSYHNGYNETLGGDGNALLFDWQTRVLIYQILQRYDGVGRQVASYFSCDHSSIEAIKKNDILSFEEYEEESLLDLIKKINLLDKNLKENYTPHNKRKLTQEQCLDILAIITFYNGYDKTLCEIFNINSKLIYRLKKKEIYNDYIEMFNMMSLEEQKILSNKVFLKYNLDDRKASRQRNGVKNSLTQEQINYILDNKDSKTRVQIGKDLGISADRVGSVILGKSYKDLVKNYYSSIK